jgi:hypothetical protein
MKPQIVLLAFALAFATSTLNAADNDKKATPDQAAFEKLKSLAGTWDGKVDDPQNGSPVKVVYKTTSNGNTVMETLFAGTDHEMVTMYYLDEGKLVLVHYCTVGNQPRMMLAKSSKPDNLVFDFAGGTNVNPSKGTHMHSARMTWEADGSIRGVWSSHKDGKPAGSHTFFLKRSA